MKILDDINVSGSGNFNSELTATSLTLTDKINLQGFDLTPHNPNGGTPDRLAYDGYVLLDEYNYGEYLDGSYVKKAGDTMTGQLGFGTTFPHIYGNGTLLVLSGKNGKNQLVLDASNNSVRPSGVAQTLGNTSYRWSNIYSVLGNFSGQITSSVATGTAPFVVASTTEVKNLNTESVCGYTINRSGFVTNEDGSTTMVPSLIKECIAYFSASVSSFWTKFAVFTAPNSNSTRIFTLLVGSEHQGGRHQGRGILELKLRNDSGTPTIYFSAVSGDIDCSCFRCYYPTTISNGTECELWVNVKRSWQSSVIKVLNETDSYTSINNIKMVGGRRTEVETPTLENYVEPTRVSLANKLATPRTLWGQSFDGSANVSGNLTGVGSITGSGLLSLISTNNDIYIKYNNTDRTSLVLNASAFKPFEAATGVFNLGTSSARWKGIYGQTLDLTGSATIGGTLELSNVLHVKSTIFSHGKTASSDGLSGNVLGQGFISIVGATPYINFYYGNSTSATSSIMEYASGALRFPSTLRAFTNSSASVSIDWFRNGYASWRSTNTSGNLIFQCNYTTAVQSSWYDVFKLNYNSGNATLKGTLTSSTLLPTTNGGANIGTSSAKWLNGYINNLYAETINVNDVIGSGWSIEGGIATFSEVNTDTLYVGGSEVVPSNYVTLDGEQTITGKKVFSSSLSSSSIATDELTSKTSPILNVTASSLDLLSCELYGYDSDMIDVWSIDYGGNAYFLSVTQTSDVNYKNITENVHLELSDIAAAPTFKFTWANKTDGKTHLGTSAQYWQEIASELVVANKKTGKLGLDYSTAALVSAISIARELESAKLEILELKDKISVLEGRIV